MTEYIDFRIFRDRSALGVINAMIGVGLNNKNIKFLINKKWHKEILLNNKIKAENIIKLNFFNLYMLYNQDITLPIQKLSLDIFFLNLLRLAKMNTFVHDLHFLSNKRILKKEFEGIKKYISKCIYIVVISFSNQIYVDSKFVQRQVKKIFNRKPVVRKIFRIFRNIDKHEQDREYDYYFHLTALEYKGIWAIKDLKFKDGKSKILLNKKYENQFKALVIDKNPMLQIEGIDLTEDKDLARAYMVSKVSVTLSKYEGFGFMPYEAAFFGSVPVIMNNTSYIEISKNHAYKINAEILKSFPSSYEIIQSRKNIAELNAKKHILLINE